MSDATEITSSEPTEPINASNKARKKPTTSANVGGLVKAGEHKIIVLEDNTRVRETDYLPNHRPITLSEFEVVATLDSAGHRPIGANTFAISTLDTLPGHRPVAVSTLHISELDTLPGHRPIASNDIDEEGGVLMGYLD